MGAPMVKIKDFTLASKNLGGRDPMPYRTPAHGRGALTNNRILFSASSLGVRLVSECRSKNECSQRTQMSSLRITLCESVFVLLHSTGVGAI